jgi:hypothetical protein
MQVFEEIVPPQQRRPSREETIMMQGEKNQRLLFGSELDAQVAQRVMGWKDVHSKSKNDYWGKKQDRAGRWRLARVPDYSSEPSLAFEVEERMKQLDLFDRYTEELSNRVRTKGIPVNWASPDQRCRAALKTVRNSRRKSYRL